MHSIHFFEFETLVVQEDKELPVKVEVIISADKSNVQEIEGVKVKLLGTETELVLSDQQKKELDEEIWENCQLDEPEADWRNEWE